MRAAALKVHPIALENVDSGYWCERSAASRGTAEAAFRTLGKVLVLASLLARPVVASETPFSVDQDRDIIR